MTTEAQRHARCASHMPHPYPKNGRLCLSEDTPERRASMQAFADHLSRVREGHHLVELARPAGDGRFDGDTGKDARTGEDVKIYVTHHNASDASPVTMRQIQLEGSADRLRLAAELDRMKGRDRSVVVPPVKLPRHNAPGRAKRTVRVSTPVPMVAKSVSPRKRGTLECPRCLQTFRFSGGYQWHLANRTGRRSCVREDLAQAI